jgi:hypothetical protein
MGTKYSTVTISGYNATPPADDGSQVASNQITWAKHKLKLGDPLKTAIESINSALVTALDTSVRAVSSNDTLTAADHNKTIQCTATSAGFAVSLGDAATMAAGYIVTVHNRASSTGDVTVNLASSTDSINNVTNGTKLLPPGSALSFIVASPATGYLVKEAFNVLQSRFYIDVAGTTYKFSAPAADGEIALTAQFAYAGLNGNAGRLLLPRDYIDGFALTTASTTTYDIAAGHAMDSTNTVNIIGGALTAKSQSAWAAGSSQGGKLSAAAMANNTWYYWFAIRKDSDGTVDYGFDVSQTPTMPSGYTTYRYIGARKTASGATDWATFIQHGDEVYWSTPPALDLSAAIVTTSARTLQAVNMPALKALWIGNVLGEATAGNNAFLILTDPACADIAVSATLAANLADVALSNTTAGTLLAGGPQRCWSNSSGRIGIRSASGGATFSIQTRGWVDPRGKPV